MRYKWLGGIAICLLIYFGYSYWQQDELTVKRTACLFQDEDKDKYNMLPIPNQHYCVWLNRIDGPDDPSTGLPNQTGIGIVCFTTPIPTTLKGSASFIVKHRHINNLICSNETVFMGNTTGVYQLKVDYVKPIDPTEEE